METTRKTQTDNLLKAKQFFDLKVTVTEHKTLNTSRGIIKDRTLKGESEYAICEYLKNQGPGRVAQSVTCLATDACLTADPGVASSIPVRSHTFVEIDHEIFSTVILLPSADLFKKGCCQLQAKVCARITG